MKLPSNVTVYRGAHRFRGECPDNITGEDGRRVIEGACKKANEILLEEKKKELAQSQPKTDAGEKPKAEAKKNDDESPRKS